MCDTNATYTKFLFIAHPPYASRVVEGDKNVHNMQCLKRSTSYHQLNYFYPSSSRNDSHRSYRLLQCIDMETSKLLKGGTKAKGGQSHSLMIA